MENDTFYLHLSHNFGSICIILACADAESLNERTHEKIKVNLTENACNNLGQKN